jgi:hypothetical protein
VLTNNTGSTLLKGSVVKPDPNNDDAIILCLVNDSVKTGIVYADIANGAQGDVVVSGVADVLLGSTATATRGYWIGVSTVSGNNGKAESISTPPTTIGPRMRQVGYAIRNQAVAGGLVRTKLSIL